MRTVLIFTTLVLAGAAVKDYGGYRVYRAQPDTDGKAEILRELRETYDFWTGRHFLLKVLYMI